MSTDETKPILKSIDRSLTQLEADVAESAAAQTEMANTLSALSGLPQQVDEVLQQLKLNTQTMGTIANQVADLTQRLNQYLDTAAREDGRVRQRLSKLEDARAERG